MDYETKAKWGKVRLALEAAGKTDCHIYKRSVAITENKSDPGPFPKRR